MTPEMRRIVARAETAARGGWSDEAVTSLAESTRGLRCDAAELARLLALPEADHGFREEVFVTDPSFHASVFALAEGETIPLHDHPRMDVISKVLRGRVRVRTYEWVDVASLVVVERTEVVLGEDDEPLVIRRSPGTLHMVTALEATAFLDLFAPYYDDVVRPCRYYVIASREDAGVPVRLRVVTWEEARR
jgi:PCO_ADO